MASGAGSNRAYTIGVQFAVAAAVWIEDNLDEAFIAAHDFMIEPDAMKDGFPFVRITAEPAALGVFTERFGEVVRVPGSDRPVGLVMSVADNVPHHTISLKV